MEFAGKSFKNVRTGEVITIIDAFQNVAITESKQKVDTRLLLDNTQYVEFIDPKSFFDSQSVYNAFAEKIKNVPMDKLKFDDEITLPKTTSNGLNVIDEPAYRIVEDNNDEMEELKRKYGAIDPASSLQKQNDFFSKFLEEDNQPVQKVEVKREEPIQPITQNNVQVETKPQIIEMQQPQNDPIISMFKNVKRNKDFNLNFEINSKIPRFDFIEMMEDSYETSIIEFLADEFTKDILKDPSIIKNRIIQEIKKLVYGDKFEENIVSQDVIVTPEVKKTTQRKSRKKVEVENDK